jgi:hypothetical protein
MASPSEEASVDREAITNGKAVSKTNVEFWDRSFGRFGGLSPRLRVIHSLQSHCPSSKIETKVTDWFQLLGINVEEVLMGETN